MPKACILLRGLRSPPPRHVADSITPRPPRLNDALILSKRLNFDVFNALDVLENDSFLKDLKFGIGDGHLQYYLYNWRCATIKSGDVGLVLL